MTRVFQAVYENGVFRPLIPIELEDLSRVTVTVHLNGSEPDPLEVLDDLIDWDDIPEGEDSEDAPSLDEVRQLLSEIPGSMSDFIIAQRDERF